MIKKTMLAACVVAVVLAAVPTFASAGVGIRPPGGHNGFPLHFELHGGEGQLVGQSTVKCTTVTGTGEFTSTTTGTVEFTFHGCTGPFGIKCNSPKQAEGTITTDTLPVHLVTVEHGEEEEGAWPPGVLITPNEETNKYATFNCSTFFHIEVRGNGLVGTITAPGYEEPSNTATVSFAPKEKGTKEQTHTKVFKEEPTFTLKSKLNGGAEETASEEAHGTITFTEGVKPELIKVITGEK